jgi:hypothetical protein
VKTLLCFVAALLGAAFAVGFVRGFLRERDSAKRDAERRAYKLWKEDARMDKERRSASTLVQQYFPFAKAAWERLAPHGDPRERLRQLLCALEGIVLGMASIGFPAVLALAERVKGLFIVGRSGGGKTTIIIRLLVVDLIRSVAVFLLGSESEFFRDWALALVPDDRIDEVVYFRPADPRCGLVWNPLIVPPGVDRAVAAGQMYTAIKRALGETEIGARADAILASALAAIIGRHDASLWALARFLEDESYRASVVAEIDDPYLHAFWTKTAAEFPSGAVLPIVTRLNRFLRVPQIRASICGPVSTVSLHESLSVRRKVFFDLGGLDPESTKLLGFLALAALQIELFRRDAIREEDRELVAVYIDEMHVFADSAEGTWRELLARGRRHGFAATLASQHLRQLPRSLQQEVTSNCSSLIAVGGVSAGEAAGLRREFVVPSESGGLAPVDAAELVSSRVGEGLARLGTGSCALRVKFEAPIPKPDPRHGRRVQETSWKNFAAPPLSPIPQPVLGEPSEPAKEPAAQGRGGAKHRLLQGLVRQWAEAQGFRATVEVDVLGGAGRVDVVLIRDDVRIAVEVAVTMTAEQIAASVTKALTAGFTMAVVLFGEDSIRQQNEGPAFELLDAKDRLRVKFLDADGFRALLQELSDAAQTEASPAGYRVVVENQRIAADAVTARRRTLARLVGAALLRDRTRA